jgi:hypothetical protein
MYFQVFLFFFKKFEFEFQNSSILEFGPARFQHISADFRKILMNLLTLGQARPGRRRSA